MTTIRDVAKRAGVSTATVSHVLNHTREVRPETARRVLEAVEELGYSQNLAARNLAVGKSHILGLIISDIQNPFFPEVTRGFQEHALLHDMETMVMNTNYDPQRTYSAVRRLLGLRVPGVAILTAEMNASLVRLLQEREVCSVYLDLGEPGYLTSNLTVDYAHGIQQALTHLAELGHERVGFIAGTTRFESGIRRKTAFLEGREQSSAAMVVEGDFTVQGGYYACAKLLSALRPTAIVAANDLMAIGALHCAFDKGIQVPSQLSIVGFDNIIFSEFTNPPLTTIAVPRERLGSLAFQTLWDLLQDEQHRGKEILIPTHLVVRQSTAAVQS